MATERWPTSQARMALSARFKLPYDDSMQDWEWEVADPARLSEFLGAYSCGQLTDDERFSLMESWFSVSRTSPPKPRFKPHGGLSSHYWRLMPHSIGPH
jgi:hypothetical protein